MHAERSFNLPNPDILSTPEHPECQADRQPTVRQWRAARIVAVSLLVGLLGNLLFYYFPAGINVPIFVLIFASVALALLWALERPIVAQNAAFIVPAVVFSALLSIVTAGQLVVLNTGLMLGSLLVALRFASVPQFLGGNWVETTRAVLETTFIGWLEGPITLLSDAFGYLKNVEIEQRRIAHFADIARGLVLTVPVVGLFVVLLSSADVLFGQLVMRAVNWINPASVDSVVAQLTITGLFTWLAMTGFRLMFHTSRPADAIRKSAEHHTKQPLFRVGMIEAGMVLGSVDALFATFMIFQARYLFGGQANITVQGYTYAEYARRGFYELLMVSFMTMLLALAMNTITHRKREMEVPFRALIGLMIGLTLLLLVAAYYRLHLYQNAYGFTRIRVMSGVFMFWLSTLLLTLLATIVWRKPHWLWRGVIATTFGFVLTLNAINMDGFIASRNITRFDRTGKLDITYLLTLSDDAVPVLSTLIQRSDLPESMRETLLTRLGTRLYTLDHERITWKLFGYHFGKDRAWHALNDHREELRPYLKPPSGYFW